MKILCLHGYTQNGSLFARKTSAIRKLLAKSGHETVFIDGPIKVEQSELSYTVEDNKDMRSWWVFKDTDPAYYRLEHALKAVKTAIDEHGPFDGILGFSQGAGLCGMLCAKWKELSPNPLKFAVFFAGFRATPDFLQNCYDPLIDIPTMHIVGSMDEIVPVERAAKLYEVCEPSKRQQIIHPGGHFVPSKKEFLEPIVAFINSPTKESQPQQEQDDDWDQFDGLGG